MEKIYMEYNVNGIRRFQSTWTSWAGQIHIEDNQAGEAKIQNTENNQIGLGTQEIQGTETYFL